MIADDRANTDAGDFARVTTFVAALKAADTLDTIEIILGEATQAYAFDHFALVQRLSRRSAIAPVRLTDYPVEWIEHLLKEERFTDDPVLIASELTVAPFTWAELPALLPLTRRHTGYMQAARARGLGQGYTVPIHVPGEAAGLCSFVTGHNRPLPARSLPAMQYLACFAFESARRLAPRPSLDTGPARLTPRQLDCVVLAARGKSNWVVGEILGISPQTVHKYLESAKQRYGVSSRTELVVRALFDGQLTFKDIVN